MRNIRRNVCLDSPPSFRRITLRSRIPVSAFCLVGLAALSGCTPPSRSSNVDMSFLTAPLTSLTPQDKETNLLPLKTGNSWHMRTATRGTLFSDTITVTGPSNATGYPSIALALERQGKPWRSEYYIPGNDTITLAGMQDETAPLISFYPPIPLAKAPFAEGASWNWHGILLIGKNRYPGSAFSRVSACETTTTAAGSFRAFRIDTVVIMNDDSGHEVRFPTVRWLAPDVGFVRRGFADKGQRAFSELTQFDVR